MKKLSEHNNIEIDGDFLDKDEVLNLFRLQKSLFEYRGILVDFKEAYDIWQRYSWDLCASWLFFPDKDIAIIVYVESSDFFKDWEQYILYAVG